MNIKSGAKFNLDRHGSTDMHKKAVEDNKSQKKGGSLRKLMLTKNANPSEEKILKAEMVHGGGSIAIFGNFWQPLFLEILKIHVKSCQKLPKIAESCQK